MFLNFFLISFCKCHSKIKFQTIDVKWLICHWRKEIFLTNNFHCLSYALNIFPKRKTWFWFRYRLKKHLIHTMISAELKSGIISFHCYHDTDFFLSFMLRLLYVFLKVIVIYSTWFPVCVHLEKNSIQLKVRTFLWLNNQCKLKYFIVSMILWYEQILKTYII